MKYHDVCNLFLTDLTKIKYIDKYGQILTTIESVRCTDGLYEVFCLWFLDGGLRFIEI